jgi:hypothetical protein
MMLLGSLLGTRLAALKLNALWPPILLLSASSRAVITKRSTLIRLPSSPRQRAATGPASQLCRRLCASPSASTIKFKNLNYALRDCLCCRLYSDSVTSYLCGACVHYRLCAIHYDGIDLAANACTQIEMMRAMDDKSHGRGPWGESALISFTEMPCARQQ